tara:strand:- start:927 stop:1379 length:453 start_codon:yes stop_codon:yes gene_type:complete
MKKKISIFLLLLFISSCGYQPLYIGKKGNKFEFKKITLEGDKDINRRIISSLQFEEKKDSSLNKSIVIQSKKNIDETSKDSKGRVASFRTTVQLNISIIENNKITINKTFLKDFSYNTKDNKFDLSEYQREVENNLVNKIIEDLILFMNL